MIDTKYKINTLVKELELKSKDVAALIEECGLGAKGKTAVLDPDEFAVFMNLLTMGSQITDMGPYLNGESYIHVEAEKPAKPTKPEKKDTKESEREEIAEKKEEAGKAPQKPVEPKKQQTPPPPPKKLSREEQQKQQQERFRSAVQKQGEKKEKEKGKPVADQKKKEKANGSGLTFRFGEKPVDTKGSVTVQQEDSSRMAGTRVIDTRAGNVDLSRYDDKLETFVSGDKKDFGGNDRMKSKRSGAGAPNTGMKGGKNGSKPGQKGNMSRSERERAALDKLRRKQEMEKKQKQLSITVPEEISVGELASRLKVTAAVVVKKLMGYNMMVGINEVIDFDAAYLVADELGAKVTREVVVTIEEKLFSETEDTDEELVERAPVVCVMGHVDHGKTSLLDAIRHTKVTAGEAGGITQAIGAYRVNLNGKDITFLDTPGHEAFTAMRARGAKSTDIAILVVAADDGIMPQTVEAIHHAKAAGIDIIVAINKMDKPGANPDAVKQGLTKYDLVPEEWGGDVICVPVSALTGMGLDELLENVLLVAEMKQLRANPNRRAKGLIIEARLDKGRGPVATVLVQTGTLHAGDVVIAGTSVGRVRAMTDEYGRTLKMAGPSVPVEITGLAEVPQAGDEFNAVEDERMARELAEQRRDKTKEEAFKASTKVTLDDLFAQISEGAKELNIIVKADVDGSAEAVKQSLEKLSNDEVKVKVIHAAAGGITEGDVVLAAASGAIIVGFNIRPDRTATEAAERQSVEIRCYRIIYECIEEIEAAMKGMLAPTFKESILGHAEVRQTIHVPNVGTIAGSYVQDGKVSRKAKIRILRDSVVIFEDSISSLKRFKDDAKEVAAGYECGIGLERFNDIKVGDILEAYEMVEVER